MKHSLAAFAALFLSLSAHAEYSFQASAGHAERRLEHIGKSASDTDLDYLSAAAFLAPVDAGDRPWRLAPFLERASLVGLEWQRSSFPNSDFSGDITATGLFAEGQAGDTPLRLGAGYTKYKDDDEFLSSSDQSYDALSYSIGWYLQEHGLLTLSGTETDRDIDGTDSGESQKALSYRLAVASSGGHWFDLNASISQTEIENISSGPVVGQLEVDRQAIGAIWYPAQVFGIGLQLARQSEELEGKADSIDSKDVTLQLTIDPAERFGLLFYFTDRETDAMTVDMMGVSTDLDTQTVGAQLDLRF